MTKPSIAQPARIAGRDADDDLRIAFHEAGHATMTYLLGGVGGAVTIDGGLTFDGMTVSTLRPGDRPLPGLPRIVRRLCADELQILQAVAGKQAEPLRHRGRPPGRQSTARNAAARETTRELTQDLLAGAEPPTTDTATAAQIAVYDAEDAQLDPADLSELSDGAVAMRLAGGLNGDDLQAASMHLNWLTRLSATLLEEHLTRVERLAAHLLVARTLSGPSVDRLLVTSRDWQPKT